MTFQFPDYISSPKFNDEVFDATGQVVSHWQTFGAHMAQLGPDGVKQIETDIRRILRENGVTYNVYDSLSNTAHAQQRLWALDAVPLIIPADDWQTIEAGVIQRAELLNLVLADLYGPQKLIKERLLPLDLLHLDPGFLRPCHDVTLPGSHQLIFYAADLARGPDNRMWVVGDRTQAPSGSGYALENRTIMSQVQSALFKKDAFQHSPDQVQTASSQGSRISRLAGYFRDMQSTLARLSPRYASSSHNNTQRVVVMTPGPHSETYFEHAYLASYLGYTLVQGDDLSVYNGAVNLKALGGLQPVDTILRRVDDTFCDPLELRSDSQLGVTGLLESVRRRQVSVVNPLGSGLLENLGIMPFLPGIAKQWLNEELILPMAATWWCGQPEELTYVLEHLDELIIKPVSGRFREPAILAERLSSKKRAELIARIRACPHRYVGQQRVGYSTAPTLINGEIKPRHTVLRTFVLARENDYTVMPGGLTRSAKAEDELSISTSDGGISKDTWVLTDEPQRHVSLWQLQAGHAVEAFHSSANLPSRAAENLFWVGRYTERVESSTRLLRTILDFFVGDSNLNNDSEYAALRQLLSTLTQVTMTYPGFIGEEEDEGEEALQTVLEDPLSEILAVTLDPEKIGGLHADLRAMINAANVVRDLWSLDTWRVLQELEESWSVLSKKFMGKKTDAQSTLPAKTNSEVGRQVGQELNRLITRLMALVGLHGDSMTHNAGWAMLDTGRRLERALRTASLIRSILVVENEPFVENLLLEAALKTTDNVITYRRRYRSHLQLQTVLDLLLLDDLSPRSLLWQLNELQRHLEQLPRSKLPYRLSDEEQILILAKTQLQLCNTQQLIQTDDESVIRGSLDALMADLTFNLSELSNVLTHSYFTHTQVRQQFGTAQVALLG